MSERATRRIGRQALREERTRLLVIAAIAALYAAATVIGFRDTYGTTVERVRFARAFAGNPALRLFYGEPHDLASVAGYAEFRLVGLLSVVLAGWGLFAAIRAFRGEEDAGRYELLLAGAVTRRGVVLAVLAALGGECVVLFAACAAGLLASGTLFGDISAAHALLLSAAIVLPGALFAVVGALASQLAGTHRGAQALAGAFLALALIVRVLADLVSGLGWLRVTTPLGWAELVRPVTGLSLGALAALVLATVLGALATLEIADRRDVATGLLGGNRRVRSSRLLLGSPARASIRSESSTLTVWVVSAGAFALLIGGFSKRIADAARTADLHELGGRVLTATGYLSLTFVFFTLLVALFAAAHVGSIRDEESSGRLETLLALPVGRLGWLGGRIAVAAGSTCLLALLIGLSAFAGAAAGDAGVGFAGLVGAGANAIPAALLFLGVGTLLYAVSPRQSGGATLALVGAAFLWELVGALLGAPVWLLDVSPFHHIAAVPTSSFDATGAAVMLVIAVATAAAGLLAFARRDLTSG